MKRPTPRSLAGRAVQYADGPAGELKYGSRAELEVPRLVVWRGVPGCYDSIREAVIEAERISGVVCIAITPLDSGSYDEGIIDIQPGMIIEGTTTYVGTKGVNQHVGVDIGETGFRCAGAGQMVISNLTAVAGAAFPGPLIDVATADAVVLVSNLGLTGSSVHAPVISVLGVLSARALSIIANDAVQPGVSVQGDAAIDVSGSDILNIGGGAAFEIFTGIGSQQQVETTLFNDMVLGAVGVPAYVRLIACVGLGFTPGTPVVDVAAGSILEVVSLSLTHSNAATPLIGGAGTLRAGQVDVGNGSLSTIIETTLTQIAMSKGGGIRNENPHVRVETGAAASFALANQDRTISIRRAVPAATEVVLPATPDVGEQHTVKDGAGVAGANPISINANGNTIDGVDPLVLGTNFASATVEWDGVEWIRTGAV